MLTGNDFIILSDHEALLLYNALAASKQKATYKDLSDMGILSLVEKIETHLFKADDKTQPSNPAKGEE